MKKITKNRKCHYMTKESVDQEDIAILSVYVPNNRDAK